MLNCTTCAKASPLFAAAHTDVACAVQLRDGCMRGDKASCQALLQQVKDNYGLLKSKLEVFTQLEAQRKHLQAACDQ